jgi:hypothetical protein
MLTGCGGRADALMRHHFREAMAAAEAVLSDNVPAEELVAAPT